MTLNDFINFIELRTKIASVFPFLVGTLYTIHRFKTFNTVNFVLFFLSLIFIDMATTSINNYMGANKKLYAVGNDKYHNKKYLAIIIILISFATIFGFCLFLRTNVILLLIGMASFFVGIIYTFGPLPLSKMPVGEVFSGFFMGFVITFLSIYIHIYNGDFLNISLQASELLIGVNIWELINIFLITVPLMCCIFNIMLTNNICDLEEDIKNKRFTLPFYIGKEKSLLLLKCIYYIPYIDFIIMAVFKILNPIILITLFTFPLVNKNISIFFKEQNKQRTFSISVKNFLIFALSYVLCLIVNVLI